MLMRRRRRWRSQTYTKPRKRKIFFIVFLIVVFLSLQTFVYLEKNLKPPLMHVAKIRVKQVATEAINKAITEQVGTGHSFDKLIDWKMSQEGKVSGFMMNYAEHMKISSETVEVVQKTLDSIKDVPEHIPIGQAFGSSLISSWGPRIPIKFVPLGAVKVDLFTRQKDAGINMLLVEVYIRITTEVSIIIPFDTEPSVVQTEVPISYLLVVGDVPMYYFDGKGNPVGQGPAPSVALPQGLQLGTDLDLSEESDPVQAEEMGEE